MDLKFTPLWGRTADGDIFQRASKTGQGMSFKVGQNDHGIIVQKMLTDADFRELLPAGNR